MGNLSPVVRQLDHALERAFEFSPFMKDFDKFFGLLNTTTPAYPFYNVVVTEEGVDIEMAVAGFGKDDLKVSFMDNILTVEGKKEEVDKNYKKRGISTKSFVRKFPVSDYLYQVKGVTYENGILTVSFTNRNAEKEVKYLDIK